MSPVTGSKPFVRRASPLTPELEGARWWNEALAASAAESAATRRTALIALGAGGGLISLFVLGGVYRALTRDDGPTSSMDALDLQRKLGWNTQDDAALVMAGSLALDAEGSAAWRPALDTRRLAERFRPNEGRLVPYYGATLFQAPDEPAAQKLRDALRPVYVPSMEDAFQRGRALGALFADVSRPRDTALVIDLPGPEAVAAAAGLADAFAPVFMFDNWPHPRGVVPSQLSIGAALYYLPVFERASQSRVVPAPAAFVLDANRLRGYRDDPALFDNRYAVSLPSLSSLRELGVAHLLYVRADDGALMESDDLNADLSALDAGGINVRAVAMTDFQPEPSSATAAANRPDGSAPSNNTSSTSSTTTVRHYYYGGSSWTHGMFWHSYGWYQPARVPGNPIRPGGYAARPSAAYHPTPRPTLFSSRVVGGGAGIGKTKPSGFGRVSVRTSSSGTVSRASSGRSGSFGRSSSSYSG